MKWLTAVLWLSCVAAAGAVVPGKEGLIAYGCDGGGICTIRPDGTGSVALTEDGQDPAWSPDGQSIVYEAAAGGIRVMLADGTGDRLLVATGADPAWSPDGQQVVYAADRGLYVIGADGSAARRLPLSYASGLLADPDWSADGRRITYARLPRRIIPIGAGLPYGGVGDIAVANADGTGERVVADQASAPAWAPDSQTIAFISHIACQPPCFPAFGRLSFVTPDGTVDHTGVGGYAPAFSPAGDRLVYAASGLRLARPDGSDAGTVRDGGEPAQPDWQALEPFRVDSPWKLRKVSKDGRKLRLLYLSGGCLKRDGRAIVKATRKRVRIRVSQGDEPPGPYTLCTDDRRILRVTARLSRPLGKRRVVGGPRL